MSSQAAFLSMYPEDDTPHPEQDAELDVDETTGADWSREGPEPQPSTCGWCGQNYDPDFVDPNWTGFCSRQCATACWQDSE